MKKYFLGIDFGTESVRAAVFDEAGCMYGLSASKNTTYYPKSGWAEQSVAQWKLSLVDAVNRTLKESQISGEKIAGIGFDATCPTLVALNKEGEALCNAIMWMDVRADKEAQLIADTKDPALKAVGDGSLSAEWFPCKVLWIKNNKPRLYENAYTILDQADWLSYMLTKELTLNQNNVTARWFYDPRLREFPSSFYKKIGIDDFLMRIPGRVLKPGEYVGGLAGSLVEDCGLPAGIPVAAGGADGYIGVIGMNVLSPEKLALITGSSHIQIALSENEIHAEGINGSFQDAIIEGYHVIEAGQTSTGSVVNWFQNNFLLEKEIDYEVMNKKAEKIALGSDGLLVLEHWQGNRTPWVDSTSRGVIKGLSLTHSAAHVYRAILEGVAYGTEVILSKLRSLGIESEEIITCGGATNSDLWIQIHADVSGKPIKIPEITQAPLLGCAILASCAAKQYSSIPEAAEKMTKIKKIFEPNSENTKRYSFFVDQYMHTYKALKELSKEMLSRSDT